MKYRRFENEIIVSLETDDIIHESIQEICRIEKIAMGTITGFGGVRHLKVGIWNNVENDYTYKTESNGSMELTNLTGNISLKDELPYTHIHVTAVDTNFRVFGGHMIEGIVQNLMELMIYPGEGIINRIQHKSWYFMDL